MKFKVTTVTRPTAIGGGQIRAINVTVDFCVCTLTTRYDNMGFVSNLLTLGHYPCTAVLYEAEI